EVVRVAGKVLLKIEDRWVLVRELLQEIAGLYGGIPGCRRLAEQEVHRAKAAPGGCQAAAKLRIVRPLADEAVHQDLVLLEELQGGVSLIPAVVKHAQVGKAGGNVPAEAGVPGVCREQLFPQGARLLVGPQRLGQLSLLLLLNAQVAVTG